MPMSSENRFDIIYLGAGLSSIIHFLKNKHNYTSKKVCFIEKGQKIDNNKTISGFAPEINLPKLQSYDEYFCSWDRAQKNYKTDIPYHILDIDLIIDEFLNKSQDCTFFYHTEVNKISLDEEFEINIKSKTILAKKVYDSRPPKLPHNKFLKQHFLGWYVRFDRKHDLNAPIIMDIDPIFNVFRFFYLLPTSDHEALIELTYFSENICEKNEYEQLIESYIEDKFKDNTYNIVKKEEGCIPLISVRSSSSIKNYQCLGFRGGFLRASTGYSVIQSFYNKRPSLILSFMDRLLLKILLISPQEGPRIFISFLKKMNANQLSSFMSYKPSLVSILYAVWAMPKKIFINHVFKSSKGYLTHFKVKGFND